MYVHSCGCLRLIFFLFFFSFLIERIESTRTANLVTSRKPEKLREKSLGNFTLGVTSTKYPGVRVPATLDLVNHCPSLSFTERFILETCVQCLLYVGHCMWGAVKFIKDKDY